MTIAQAFNEIAVAQGGTAAKSGNIASAIDALNDALAGSDQKAATTIEGAVRLLGEHIGSGGGGGSATSHKLYVAAMSPDGPLPQNPQYYPNLLVDGVRTEFDADTVTIQGETLPLYSFEVVPGALVTYENATAGQSFVQYNQINAQGEFSGNLIPSGYAKPVIMVNSDAFLAYIGNYEGLDG